MNDVPDLKLSLVYVSVWCLSLTKPTIALLAGFISSGCLLVRSHFLCLIRESVFDLIAALWRCLAEGGSLHVM